MIVEVRAFVMTDDGMSTAADAGHRNLSMMIEGDWEGNALRMQAAFEAAFDDVRERMRKQLEAIRESDPDRKPRGRL